MDLISDVVGKMSDSSENINDPTLKTVNIILNVWDSSQNSLTRKKKLVNARLKIFGSIYACKNLLSSMNFL